MRYVRGMDVGADGGAVAGVGAGADVRLCAVPSRAPRGRAIARCVVAVPMIESGSR